MAEKLDQIIASLQARIIAGEFAGNHHRLPPQRELCREMQTSRETMYKAIAQLKGEGILQTIGKGVYALPPRIRVEGLTKRFDEHLAARGLRPIEYDIIVPSVETMPISLADIFGVSPQEQFVHRHRMQGSEQSGTMRLAENFYKLHLAEREVLDAIRADQRADALEMIKQLHGRYVVEVEERSISRLPKAMEVELLSITRLTPVTVKNNTNYDQFGQVIYYNETIYDANKFEFVHRYKVHHWDQERKGTV